MNKPLALFIALLLTILIASNFYFYQEIKKVEPNRERAIVARVIDGDTIELNDSRHVRLLNINSPEKTALNHEQAMQFLKTFEKSEIELEITDTDKYDRSLARIYRGEYLNLKIVQLGLASKFLVDKSETKDFAKAEDYAIENSLGIWRHSKYYGCFKSSIDYEKEEVLLTNTCETIQMQNFFLKDESRKTFVFPKISIGAVKIHSLEGQNNETDLFIGSTTNVWNNDRDTLYLFDPEGNIVLSSHYGY